MTTLLIVEDNQDTQHILATAMTAEGYTVQTANHGYDALRYLKKHRVDGIILDLDMPVMDGFSLVTEMHMDKALRHIPIMILTGAHNTDMVAEIPGVKAAYSKGDIRLREIANFFRSTVAS